MEISLHLKPFAVWFIAACRLFASCLLPTQPKAKTNTNDTDTQTDTQTDNETNTNSDTRHQSKLARGS